MSLRVLTGISAGEYRSRRRQLMDAVGSDGIIVLPAAPERVRSHDTHYPYRQDSHFQYLLGFGEPQAVLVMLLSGKVAVVACASSGIGRTIAEHDAEEGPGWCLSRTAPWKPSIPSFRSISSTRRRSCVSSSPASARGSIRFVTNFPTQLGPCGQEIVVDGGYTIG